MQKPYWRIIISDAIGHRRIETALSREAAHRRGSKACPPGGSFAIEEVHP